MEERTAGHFIQNRFHHPVPFLPLTAGAQRIRLPPRHTAPPGVVCAGRHFHFFEPDDLSSERFFSWAHPLVYLRKIYGGMPSSSS